MTKKKSTKMTLKEKTKSISTLRYAISCVGTQQKLADMLGISRPCITAWAKGTELIPIARAIQMENILQKKVTMSELRPDTLKLN